MPHPDEAMKAYNSLLRMGGKEPEEPKFEKILEFKGPKGTKETRKYSPTQADQPEAFRRNVEVLAQSGIRIGPDSSDGVRIGKMEKSLRSALGFLADAENVIIASGNEELQNRYDRLTRELPKVLEGK